MSVSFVFLATCAVRNSVIVQERADIKYVDSEPDGRLYKVRSTLHLTRLLVPLSRTFVAIMIALVDCTNTS